MAHQTVEIVLRLALAVLLGGLVGLERETRRRQAGLRTFILVCLGATLMMVVSLAMPGFGGSQPVSVDPGRIAAQVVTGIGFLGAGTILREGPTIRGLTTAAGLWVVAGIGLAVGAGLYLEAVIVTLLVLATLVALAEFEKRLPRGGHDTTLALTIDDRPGGLGQVGSALGARDVDIRDIQLRPAGQAGEVRVEMVVRLPARADRVELTAALAALDVVRGVELGD